MCLCLCFSGAPLTYGINPTWLLRSFMIWSIPVTLVRLPNVFHIYMVMPLRHRVAMGTYYLTGQREIAGVLRIRSCATTRPPHVQKIGFDLFELLIDDLTTGCCEPATEHHESTKNCPDFGWSSGLRCCHVGGDALVTRLRIHKTSAISR